MEKNKKTLASCIDEWRVNVNLRDVRKMSRVSLKNLIIKQITQHATVLKLFVKSEGS